MIEDDFSDESLQTIDCTHTGSQTRNNLLERNTQNMKKLQHFIIQSETNQQDSS